MVRSAPTPLKRAFFAPSPSGPAAASARGDGNLSAREGNLHARARGKYLCARERNLHARARGRLFARARLCLRLHARARVVSGCFRLFSGAPALFRVVSGCS